jgi:hypothetical protein
MNAGTQTQRLEDAASAHRDLRRHHLGKLAFDVRAS